MILVAPAGGPLGLRIGAGVGGLAGVAGAPPLSSLLVGAGALGGARFCSRARAPAVDVSAS